VPELPDLVYIAQYLERFLGKPSIKAADIREPIVIRMAVPGGFAENLTGKRLGKVLRYGPFLKISLDPLELVIHFMLAGKLYIREKEQKKPRDICFSLYLDDGRILYYTDARKMGKIYVVEAGDYSSIPAYLDQGVDILSDAFNPEVFRRLLGNRRHQVRVFLMDQKALSAIGNAYADEILFEAGIHPKTLCSRLEYKDVERLYRSIGRVIQWGIREIEAAGKGIDIKVREHLHVRNRKGAPCPRCGTTIRRTSVLGYDSFFCPRCQPSTRKTLVPWDKTPADIEEKDSF
jgi:formamidopyrimidine-DNA glycosylase